MENGFNDTERGKEYVQMKECPRNESFAHGKVGAGVRLMVRRGYVHTVTYHSNPQSHHHIYRHKHECSQDTYNDTYIKSLS